MDDEFMTFVKNKLTILCQGKKDTEDNFIAINEKLDPLITRVTVNEKAISHLKTEAVTNLAAIEGKVDPMVKKVTNNEEEIKLLKTENSELKVKLEELESRMTGYELERVNSDTEVRHLNTIIVELEEHLQLQEKKFMMKQEDLENRQRRNNIVISGLEEKGEETWEETERIVLEFLKERLNLEVSIQRAHRLGRAKGKPRPIIVLLSNFKDKGRIMANAKQLKGSSHYINEDYSFHTRLARSELLQYAKKTHEGKRYRLAYNLLYVDNRKFSFGDTGVYEIVKTN